MRSLVLLSLLCAGEVMAAPAEQVHRYAVLAAASDGGPGRVKLRYAKKDARTVSRVLSELGGIPLSQQVRLEEPNKLELLSAISGLNERLAMYKDARVELFLYYSGHSDEDGLLLDSERVTYKELRSALAASVADVRIAILDSCASGAMTRQKGGVKRPPFLVDASNKVRGYAVLTSSSDTEAAQESDRIQASFFTHYLVSGLRGAADIGGDGRVTLNEAYHFAFHETLARTERTQAGAQHPAYDIQLVGMGDLIMTDLRATSATLMIDGTISGRLYLREKDGALVAELNKPAGRVVELGLAPGDYTVTLEHQGEVLGGAVRLIDGQKTRLKASQLGGVDVEATVSRGGEPSASAYEHVPVNISLIPALSFGGAKKKRQNFVINLLWSKYAVLEGLELGLGLSTVEEGMYGLQISMGGNLVLGVAKGIQLATGFNYTKGLTLGLQASTGLNLSGGFDGVQASAGLNISGGVARGLQATVGLNIADQIRGMQVSSGLNLTDVIWGVQAGLLNMSGATYGAQLSLLNIGGAVQGAQVGLVNIATGRLQGFQLGLVNYATELDGVGLGLLNFVAKNGMIKPALWASDVALMNVGIKLGSKYFYSVLAGGLFSAQSRDGLSLGAGLGGHIPVSDEFSVDLDAIAYRVEEQLEFTGTSAWIVQVRLTPMLQLFKGVALFGGPALNIHLADSEQGFDTNYRPGYAKVLGSGRVAMWPGFVAGLQFF